MTDRVPLVSMLTSSQPALSWLYPKMTASCYFVIYSFIQNISPTCWRRKLHENPNFSDVKTKQTIGSLSEYALDLSSIMKWLFMAQPFAHVIWPVQ